MNSNIVKPKMEYLKLPDKESWRIPSMKGLMSVNNQQLVVPGFDNNEINDMLYYACTS